MIYLTFVFGIYIALSYYLIEAQIQYGFSVQAIHKKRYYLCMYSAVAYAIMSILNLHDTVGTVINREKFKKVNDILLIFHVTQVKSSIVIYLCIFSPRL